MTPIKKTSLAIETIDALRTTFAQNGWDPDRAGIFRRFCDTLEFLSPEQQALLLKLTADYLWIDIPDYMVHLSRALSLIDSASTVNVDNFYALPLLDPRDFGKAKSSTLVLYLMRLTDVRSHPAFHGHPPRILSTPANLPAGFAQARNLLILVDDFIGSGTTAEACLSPILNKHAIPAHQVVVLAMVAQESGLQKIRDLGVGVYCPMVRSRGITDAFPDPDRTTLLTIMDAIEEMLSVEADYRRGFRQSEALVTMARTPNNTFPVYWFQPELAGGARFVAPFPR